jgi:hypothetical protein
MLSLCMCMSMVLTCKEEREKLFLFVKDDKQFFFIIIGNEQYRNLVTIINLMLWQNKLERLSLMKYFWLGLIFTCKIYKNIRSYEQYRNLVTIINLMLLQNKLERLTLMKYFWLGLIFSCKIYTNIRSYMKNLKSVSLLKT